MRTIIAFDVSDDRKRYRVARILEDHALRVQKSVFEARDLSEKRFLRLRSKLEEVIDRDTDSLRYYRLCRACLGRITQVGRGPAPLPPPDDFEVV